MSTIKFTVRVDLMVQPHERQMLTQIADTMHCTPSAALRHMIYAAHQHLIQNEPRCADGTKCAHALATESLSSAIANLAPPTKRRKCDAPA